MCMAIWLTILVFWELFDVICALADLNFPQEVDHSMVQEMYQ